MSSIYWKAWSTSLLVFVFVSLLLGFCENRNIAVSAWGLPFDLFNFSCPSNSTYDFISEECLSCMENSAPGIDGSCKCNPGFALVEYVGSSAPVCVNCASENKVVSPLPGANGSFFCVSCWNDPSDSVRSAVYNSEKQECECVSNSSILAMVVDGMPLTSQQCLPVSDFEITCTYPYMPLTPDNGSIKDRVCTCVEGLTLMEDGSCVSSSIYQELLLVAQDSSLDFVPANLHGSSSVSFPFPVAETVLVQSATKCYEGNSTECEFLSNMCVLMNYETGTTPCRLYLYLHESIGEVGRLPKLFYFEDSDDIFKSFSFSFSDLSTLNFVVSTYDVSGLWLGMKPLTTELNLCDKSNLVEEMFLKAGSTLELSCDVNWNWIATQSGILGASSLFPSTDSASTLLYELFLVNPINQSGQLIPIPILLDFSNDIFSPDKVSEPFFYQGPAEETVNNTAPLRVRYFRRFYVYSSVEVPIDLESPMLMGSQSLASTAARTVALVLLSFSRGQWNTPFYAIQYASHLESKSSIINHPELLVPLSFTGSADTVRSSVRLVSLSNSLVVVTVIIVVIVVVMAVCVCTALVQLYGYMRRRQNMMLDLSAFLVWVTFFLNHASNSLLISVAVVTWVILIMYKFSGDMLISFSESQEYIYMTFIVAVIAKGVVLVYRLLEQCNAEYYIIDWERSKGQLLRENELVPVSMWRSNFVANQLNRLQTLRCFHVKLILILVTITLLEFDVIRFSKSVFATSFHGNAEYGVSNLTLCIGVGTLLWWVISLVIYLIEFQLYYRFLVVSPFQAFVDLCSVSNISVLALLEPMWGFYIHGRTIHAHADVTMDELQQNLALEAEGNLPVRGLGGQSKCQTFEVFISPYMRQYLYLCKMEIEYQQHLKKIGRSELHRNVRPIYRNPYQWHFFEFLKRRKKREVVYSKGGMIMKEQINQSLQQCVHRAEGSLFSKMSLQRLIGFPPNILYMNGAQRGDVGSKDLFFFDFDMSFKNCFLYSLDFDVCLFCSGLFTIFMAFANVYVAVIVTFFIEFFIEFYRGREGRSNFSLKSLIPESFLR